MTALHRQSSNTARVRALGVHCIPGDLGNLDALRGAVRGQDAVVHAAGADLKYWSRNEDLLDQVNVVGTGNVARASRLEKMRLLHVSSVCAIGIPPNASHPAHEEFQFNLQGTPLVYNISKKGGEDAVLQEVSSAARSQPSAGRTARS